MRILILISLICAFWIPQTLQAAAETKYARQQVLADELYGLGKYQEAMKQYLPLAKKGDSFSQYRVSYMYLEGQGVEPDLVESYAWAYLAAQNHQKELIQYRNTVGSLVPEKEHRKALRRVDYYMRKWGNIAIADDAARGARQQLRKCTGSRVGARCEEVESVQMPSFWAIAPGSGSNPGSGGDGGGSSPSGSNSSARSHGAGGSTRDVAYYQQLRSSIREMNRYIEENSGTVTLGEFQVLEDEQPAEAEADGG